MEFILICHHVLFVVLVMQSISLHISRGSAEAGGGKCAWPTATESLYNFTQMSELGLFRAL